jgi:GAF domain-containing protein
VEPVPGTREVLKGLMDQGDIDLVTALFEMGRLAQEIVPECVGLSLGQTEDGIVFTLVASSVEVAAIDAAQYLDGGPCVEASTAGRPMDVDPDDPLDENRWAIYARASAAAGVASSLSLPLLAGDRVVGGVNLYASTPNAFDGHHEELANALDASAKGAVTNADLSFRTRREAERAPAWLADSQDVNIAVSLICERQQVDEETARTRLRGAAERAGITEIQAARAVSYFNVP